MSVYELAGLVRYQLAGTEMTRSLTNKFIIKFAREQV
jgi:hypothetical protein